jgi:hypothetical protein
MPMISCVAVNVVGPRLSDYQGYAPNGTYSVGQAQPKVQNLVAQVNALIEKFNNDRTGQEDELWRYQNVNVPALERAYDIRNPSTVDDAFLRLVADSLQKLSGSQMAEDNAKEARLLTQRTIQARPRSAKQRDSGVPISSCASPSRPKMRPSGLLPTYPTIVCVQSTLPATDGPWNPDWQKYTGPEVYLNGGARIVQLTPKPTPKLAYYNLPYADARIQAVVRKIDKIITQWNEGWVPTRGDLDEWGKLVGMDPQSLSVNAMLAKIGAPLGNDIDYKFVENSLAMLARIRDTAARLDVLRNPYGEWSNDRGGAWSPDLPATFPSWQAYFLKSPIDPSYWGIAAK